MKKINENHMAKIITLEEGGKTNQDIAQIKETLKITLDYLANEWNEVNEESVITLIKKHIKSPF